MTRKRPMEQDEIERAVRLLRDGYSRAGAAAVMGVERHRISRLVARAGTTITAIHAAAVPTYTRMDVARLFGVEDALVRRWIAQGWLHTTRSRTDRRGFWRIRRPDVCAFLRERIAWMSYSPALMTDAELCTFARIQRANAGGQWEPVTRIIAALGYHPSNAYYWIRTRGWPGKEWELADWYGCWLWLPYGTAYPAPPCDQRNRPSVYEGRAL